MKHEKQVEIQNAAVQVVTRLMLGLSPALHGLLCECVCVCASHTYLLLAVKVAAKAMPDSLFFRLVGESTLPVL